MPMESNRHSGMIGIFVLCLLGTLLWPAVAVAEEAAAVGGSDMAWWVWPLLLFLITLIMGILAVLGGVGGGVLFVPIISGFFPLLMYRNF